MPIFRDQEGEEGTFGPSMSAAMSLHRAKKGGKKEHEEKGEGKDKVKHHLDKAKEHLDAATAAHEGHEEDDMEGFPSMGGGMSALMGDEEER